MRQGGVGEGAYGSFNITHYCGDAPENVAANRKLLCEELGIENVHLILPRQTHDTLVEVITPENLSDALEGVDAVVTNLESVCIGVSTADCIPLLYFDPTHRVIAAIHAGWRGTVNGIARKALHVMMETFGTQPEDVQVVVGPGISAASFEVGEEVVEAFAKAGFPMAEIRHINPLTGKSHLDLWEANVGLLFREGVKRENVQQSGICTYQSHETYFSARRLGIHSGRIFTGIML
jgi:YfiH family protein